MKAIFPPCPLCGQSSKVLKNYPHPNRRLIRRRHECRVCRTRFWSRQEVEPFIIPETPPSMAVEVK